MTTPQFDTHRVHRTLAKQGGFNEAQADAVVEALDQAVNENLGTKTDLNLLRAEMKQGFTEANADTKQGFTEANAAVRQASTEANAAVRQTSTEVNAANEKLLAEIDKKFAALYRFLSVFGAALVAIMITLFVAQ